MQFEVKEVVYKTVLAAIATGSGMHFTAYLNQAWVALLGKQTETILQSQLRQQSYPYWAPWKHIYPSSWFLCVLVKGISKGFSQSPNVWFWIPDIHMLLPGQTCDSVPTDASCLARELRGSLTAEQQGTDDHVHMKQKTGFFWFCSILVLCSWYIYIQLIVYIYI